MAITLPVSKTPVFLESLSEKNIVPWTTAFSAVKYYLPKSWLMSLPVDEFPIFNNRYQILAKIGEGGLAEVYRAQDVALGRLVAVKALRREYVVDPAFLVRFHQEAQSAARLTHPNIVAVYDFGQDQGRPYIVMEYVPGRDLRALLANQGVMPVGRALEICIRICAGVGYAHRAGLVHGDIKPGNVLIAPDGRVKVVDFGLARALGDSAMDEDGGLVWGTPAYFSPEQATGSPVLPATDVYAIGVILYEMLTGQLPFVGEDIEVARKHLYDTPVPANQVNPRIPGQVAAIIGKALKKQPAERFATADQMGQALAGVKREADRQTGFYRPFDSSRTDSVPGATTSHIPPTPKRRMDWIGWVLGLVAALAVLGLIPLWLSVYRAHSSPPTPTVAPTPTLTLSPGQVRVPDVVGMELEDGRRTMAAVGLQLEVIGQTTHPTVPAFAIIEQSVRTGIPVDDGTSIGVVISQGPELVEIPAVIGLPLGQAESQLSAKGLEMRTQQAWSEDTPGQVIDQDPPAGSLVDGGSAVSLVVSSGTRVPVGARLGDGVLLVAYELPRLDYRSGETLPITLVWQCFQKQKEAYKVFVHLTQADGSIVSQQDGVPVNGSQPTDSWIPGNQVVDQHELNIPPGTQPGEYWLRTGMYNADGRMPVTDAGRISTEGDVLVLSQILVN